MRRRKFIALLAGAAFAAGAAVAQTRRPRLGLLMVERSRAACRGATDGSS